MIICFTGQPNSGKTTLANELVQYLYQTHNNITVLVIDGDLLRSITGNVDYSKNGRHKNVKTAIDLAINSDKYRDYTIISLVSPFRDLRELLKNNPNHIVKEIYLHSNRFREGKMVSYYEPPLNNYLDLDTDTYTIEKSLNLILNYIQ